MIWSTIKQLSRQLAAKKISSVELATLYLNRIEALNPALNALITVDRAKTLAEASAADVSISTGNTHELTGVPIIHKDLFCQKGWKTTCGSKILNNFVSPYSAHVVERCSAAGLVTLGRANMDEFAMGSSNETSYYGAVKNPWDPRAIPGGSSGGSAAAVAARLTPAATATDTGGSIRQPASHCGVTGIKPTYGVVSRYGMVAYASSLDQGGVIAQSAEDCALILNVIAGFDQRDSTSLERPHENYARHLEKPLNNLKVGLPREYFSADLSADVARTIDEAVRTLKKQGVQIVDISLPHTAFSLPAYYVIAPAEAASNLARYDGVRYGHRATAYKDLLDMYEQTRAEGFGSEVKRRILIGTYVLSQDHYEAYYMKAQKIRQLIANDFKKTFEQCDLILGPVAPTAAFDIGAINDNQAEMYLADTYTLSVNLAGLPGMSLPAGFSVNGRPIGLQIIGNYFTEAKMLNVAHQFQLATDWHTQTPNL